MKTFLIALAVTVIATPAIAQSEPASQPNLPATAIGNGTSKALESVPKPKPADTMTKPAKPHKTTLANRGKSRHKANGSAPDSENGGG
jgi:hypothetical protein